MHIFIIHYHLPLQLCHHARARLHILEFSANIVGVSQEWLAELGETNIQFIHPCSALPFLIRNILHLAPFITFSEKDSQRSSGGGAMKSFQCLAVLTCVPHFKQQTLVLNSAMSLSHRRIGIQMISNNEISKCCTRRGLVTAREEVGDEMWGEEVLGGAIHRSTGPFQ